jgi:starch synthase (maltosyl-transferring)
MKEISQLADGRGRVVIERVWPQIDCGRFPIKRIIGETVVVEADVFADGHDHITCQVLYSREGDKRATNSGNRHP